MKKDLFDFSDFDDNIVENIAEKYPDMDKSEQKALCGKVHKRLDITENSTFADSVSGVEPAKKPVFRYIFGTAAAAVFALAVIPLAFNALKNSPDAPENIQESQIIVDYNTSPTESEDSSTEAVTTKIGESDIIAEITTPVDNTDESAAAITTAPEKPEENESEDNPPISEGKKTTKAANGTTPRVTTKPVRTTTKPVTTKPDISKNGIFDMLANLSYSPYTCDGIADYVLTAEDGTTYQILTGCKHVWRNGSEEADITPEILEWVEKYGEPYKVKEYNATAEIDWYTKDKIVHHLLGNGFCSGTFTQYTTVTNTSDLTDWISIIFTEDIVEQYAAKYDDEFFENNVLCLNQYTHYFGNKNNLSIKNISISNDTIDVTAELNVADTDLPMFSLSFVQIIIPNELYYGQIESWNIISDLPNDIIEYECDNLSGCIRRRKILNGEMDADTPRITLNQAKNIINNISDTTDYRDLVMEEFNKICGSPDLITALGDQQYRYWLDDNGSKWIAVLIDEEAIYYIDADNNIIQQLK